MSSTNLSTESADGIIKYMELVGNLKVCAIHDRAHKNLLLNRFDFSNWNELVGYCEM